MPGISPKRLFDNCINAKRRYNRAIRVTPDDIRVNYFFSRNNNSLAGIDFFKVNSQRAPFLSIPFCVGLLNVKYTDIRHHGLDDTDLPT